MKAILAGAEQHRGSSDRHRGELEPEKFPTRHSARSDFVPIGRFLLGPRSFRGWLGSDFVAMVQATEPGKCHNLSRVR